MSTPRGTVDVTIHLNKNTCYFLKTGKCSLNVVSDFACSSTGKPAAGDLLYCPKLYKAMKSKKEQMRPITVALCECGHGEVVSGHQRACIASQLNLPLPVRAAQEEARPSCSICGGQITFDSGANDGGSRIVTLHAVAVMDGEHVDTKEKDSEK